MAAKTVSCLGRSLGAAAAVAAGLAVPVTAHAYSLQGQQIMKNWAASDRCVAAAQKAFPDYTADSLTKRDQATKQCLAGGGLPPRAPLLPAEPPRQ